MRLEVTRTTPKAEPLLGEAALRERLAADFGVPDAMVLLVKIVVAALDELHARTRERQEDELIEQSARELLFHVADETVTLGTLNERLVALRDEYEAAFSSRVVETLHKLALGAKVVTKRGDVSLTTERVLRVMTRMQVLQDEPRYHPLPTTLYPPPSTPKKGT